MNEDISAARIATVNAYDRWKAASRQYERIIDLFGDERLIAEAIARGHHLNLCLMAAVSSARAERTLRRLLTRLDLQNWLDSGASVANQPGRAGFKRQAPC